MPEDVERFAIAPRRAEPLGRLVLAAAEKGWEVNITFQQVRGVPGAGGLVYDVCVKDFPGR